MATQPASRRRSPGRSGQPDGLVTGRTAAVAGATCVLFASISSTFYEHVSSMLTVLWGSVDYSYEKIYPYNFACASYTFLNLQIHVVIFFWSIPPQFTVFLTYTGTDRSCTTHYTKQHFSAWTLDKYFAVITASSSSHTTVNSPYLDSKLLSKVAGLLRCLPAPCCGDANNHDLIIFIKRHSGIVVVGHGKMRSRRKKWWNAFLYLHSTTMRRRVSRPDAEDVRWLNNAGSKRDGERSVSYWELRKQRTIRGYPVDFVCLWLRVERFSILLMYCACTMDVNSIGGWWCNHVPNWTNYLMCRSQWRSYLDFWNISSAKSSVSFFLYIYLSFSFERV